MERKLEAFSWQEIYKAYKQYARRLVEIQTYRRIADDKVPLSVKPGDLIPGMEYNHRLVSDEIRIFAKLKVLDREIYRRNHLIGVTG